MPIPEKQVIETELDGMMSVNGGPEKPVKAVLTTTLVTFQVRGRVEVDFAKLRASGELDHDALNTLERDFPGAPILFMGKAPGGGIKGRDACIGVKTGPHVYPMHMFFISQHTAVDCCTPVDEPPHVVEPY